MKKLEINLKLHIHDDEPVDTVLANLILLRTRLNYLISCPYIVMEDIHKTYNSLDDLIEEYENRITGLVTELQDNEVFVFGSNLAGKHGKGAAKLAKKWGAKNGEGIGLWGSTYAIPTKDKKIKTLPLEKIKPYVEMFIECVECNPDCMFLVTEIGCGLAGYTPEDVAPMFKKCVELENVKLPLSFWKVLGYEES